MSGLIDIKAGDWVLVDHPYFSDAYVVRRVVSVTKAKFVGEIEVEDCFDKVFYWKQDNARNRSNIRGVFPGENAALAAAVAVRELYEIKQREEKAARVKFHASAKALLDPQ